MYVCSGRGRAGNDLRVSARLSHVWCPLVVCVSSCKGCLEKVVDFLVNKALLFLSSLTLSLLRARARFLFPSLALSYLASGGKPTVKGGQHNHENVH